MTRDFNIEIKFLIELTLYLFMHAKFKMKQNYTSHKISHTRQSL